MPRLGMGAALAGRELPLLLNLPHIWLLLVPGYHFAPQSDTPSAIS